MKNRIAFGLFLLYLLIGSTSLIADSYLGGEPRLPGERTHPYLLFRDSEVAGLLEKKDQSPLFANWYEAISTDAQTGSGGDDALEKAFMYQMTDSTKYLDWLPINYLFSITDELIRNTTDNGLTRYALRAAFIYDWIQPGLTQSQDDSARANLIRLAEYHYDWVKNSDGNHFIEDGIAWSNNHNFGHQAALALLAITLPENEMAQTWLETALNYQFEQFSFYIQDAPYYEGSHFSDIFLDLDIPHFYSAYKHACGIDVFDDTRIPLEKMFYSTLVEQMMPNHYTDPTRGAQADNKHVTKEEGYRPNWRLLVSLLHNPDEPNWALGDPIHDSEIGEVWLLIFPYITYSENISFLKTPDINPTLELEGNHEMVFRRDWSPSSSFLHFYGRTIPTGYHGHCDQLTFNLYSHGVLFVTDYEDDGNSNDRHRPEYHNVIMADGEMAVDRYGHPFAGGPTKSILDSTRIKLFFTTPFIDGGEISVDYAYTGNLYYSNDDIVELHVDDVSVSRTILYIKDMSIQPDNEYWVVVDKVTAEEPHDYEWLLHGVGTISGSGNESRTFTAMNDQQEEVSLLAYFCSPSMEIENRLESGYGRHIAGRVRGEDLNFLTFLYPWKTQSMASPRTTGIDQPGQKGFQLIIDEGEDVVEDVCYLQEPPDGTGDVMGITSDAELTFLRKKNSDPYSLMLKNGSFITQNEHPLLESTSDLDVVSLRYKESTGGHTVDGALQCSAGTEVSFFSPEGELISRMQFPPGSHDIDLSYGEGVDHTPPDAPEDLTIH